MKVDLLYHYQKILEKLNISNNALSKEEVLEILLTRDAIEKVFSTKVKPSASVILKLENLDSKLKDNSGKLIEVIDLPKYRENFPKSTDAWWWYLDIYCKEKERKSHPWNRFDWLFKVIRLLVWTGNLALLGTLATLFLSSGSGFLGAITIAFPSILSLLQAQSELTETGKKGFDKFLEKLKIPQHFHEEAKLGTYLLMTVFLLLIWVNLPLISNIYKQKGKEAQDNKQLAQAEENYLKAIELNSDNLDAHYKLGTLYEELQDFNNTKKQYLIAAKGGYLDAYNNLAYWYIRENKAPSAINLLNQSLKLVEEKEQNLEKLTELDKLDLKVLKYSLYKNLGWARFERERDEEAKIYLTIATGIASNPEIAKYIRNPGTAYCLLAQVLERQQAKSKTVKPVSQSSEINKLWQKCHKWNQERLAAGENLNPEEEDWLYQAKQKLK